MKAGNYGQVVVDPSALMNARDVCLFLRIGKTKLEQLRDAGELGAGVAIGSNRLYRRCDIEAFIQRNLLKKTGAK